MNNILPIIPLLPLLGFLLNGVLFRKMPHRITSLVACGSVFGSFVLSVMVILQVINSGTPLEISLGEWFSTKGLTVSFNLMADQLTSVMLLVVTGVGFLIHVYSIGYMSHDKGYNRFFSYMNLFVFFMLVLVMGSNYLLMFIGWEGVGLSSYLLIGFWFKNGEYNNAARKAFIMNRIGDLGFLLGMILMAAHFGSLEYREVFTKATLLPVGDGMLTAATLLLFIGAMGKSAQIPLYTWLPDAMAGPTPVSALIHAATMVTAGVYMVARSQVIYMLAPISMQVVAITGLATALLAASIALYQNDIKKVLAYSTVSQLGYMFIGLGMGAFTGAIFHLVTHAFFKALLFLGAGSIIHALSGEQDLRNMGGLRKKLPFTFITFLIATITISGIPPFAGFFSKDEILMHAFESNKLIWLGGLLGSMLTAFYMFRLLYLAFYGSFRGSAEGASHIHESPAVMTIPLIILAALSVLGGLIGVPEVLGGSHALNHFLAGAFQSSITKADAISHSTEILLMGIAVSGALLMIFLAWFVYVKNKKLPVAEEGKLSFFPRLLANKYYVDELYNLLFIRSSSWLSGFLHAVLETKIIDGTVNFTGNSVVWMSGQFRKLQHGTTGFYLVFMVLGIIGMLIFGFIF
ncbi:MAG: NADH-quinone oxidoreductase subunit L [Bacteroidales bacterium]